jgi:phosphoserine phosphatase RsbU/P
MPLFEKEINFLENAKAQLANPNTDALQQHYPALVQEYEALLNQVQKLVKISDNTQHKLVNARETIENQNKIIHNDLKKAEDYIKSLLPKPINNDKCKISSHFIPSAQLGGDTFGYHFLDGDNLAIYLIDASGHGVGSALHSVSVLNTLRFETLQDCNFYNPSSVMKSLNRVFKMAEHNNLYFTLWYGVLNLRTLELTHAESGHPPALVFSPNSSLEECESSNYLIGVLDDYDFE